MRLQSGPRSQREIAVKVLKREDGAVLVPLTNSEKFAIVDAGWEEDVLKQRWCLNEGYARTTIWSGVPGYQKIYLHDLIMGENPGFEVDHMNGNRLDNRTDNLRFVTKTEQRMNSGMRSNNTSGVVGVSFIGLTKKWGAWIRVNKRSVNLGSFMTFEEAHAARQKAEKEFFGEYARKTLS